MIESILQLHTQQFSKAINYYSGANLDTIKKLITSYSPMWRGTFYSYDTLKIDESWLAPVNCFDWYYPYMSSLVSQKTDT